MQVIEFFKNLQLAKQPVFRKIAIQKKTPRAVQPFSSAFGKGLRMYRFFGYFFLIGGLYIFAISIFKFDMIFPGIFFLAMSIMGFFMIKKVRKRVKSRKEVFRFGKPIRATVEKQGRKFNFLKSERDYTITVSYKLKDYSKLILIVSKKRALWHECPVGKNILGLEYNGDFFFGEEIGCKFKIQ